MPPPNIIVRPVHFEDFSGREFERLVFAFLVRAGWQDVSWYGEGGSDGGRDIIGIEPRDGEPSRLAAVQCANRDALTLSKVTEDITKARTTPATPEAFLFVCRGSVSAVRRDEIAAIGRNLGVGSVAVWSGVEFEERLRLIGEDLLRRFCNGEPFPGDASELRTFASDFPGMSDDEILHLMAAVFDRPAFRTPFHSETSLPAFLAAIEDTIRALNTGVWRTRDGVEIRRIPTVHHLRDPKAKAAVARSIQAVDGLRRIFVEGVRKGSIRACGCRSPDCPVFQIEPCMCHRLDEARREVFRAFRLAYVRFNVHLD